MKNKVPQKVLVIGSGPIIIGQAAEFDYAGTQACKSLREEGITTVLVNSNPATIMTDSDVADRVYIEPLTVKVLERIIDLERPDGLLPTLGGQTGLNLAVALSDAGILERYEVSLLGTSIETIRQAEDRAKFRELLDSIGEPTPPSQIVTTVEDAIEAARQIGLPVAIRPAYTLGGTGGGFANNETELKEIAQSGISASPIGQILIERSLLGWKEIEYEVMRDAADTCITICNMENLDPMGVHTGDSIVVAPSQTLSDPEYQTLRSASLRIIRALDIRGGCNVQFALSPHPLIGEVLPGQNPEPLSYYVIEVNPRVSRSSALASKATGYPIARVAAKIAIGKRLDQITNAVTQRTKAAFEPTLDYCVVKIPRWPFDKFPFGHRQLGTQMKATGEVMAIDRNFESALQKAIRSLEINGKSLLWENPEWQGLKGEELPFHASDERIWSIVTAVRRGVPTNALAKLCFFDPWFLDKIAAIIRMEKSLLNEELSPDLLFEAKKLGFSDEVIATLSDKITDQVRNLRLDLGIKPSYKMVDTCAAEFEALTPYFYSCYDVENEAIPLTGKRALVIGSGPIRIGQGIEFDYCSVHAAWALQESGYRSIMINSNPETVSTDFDTSDRLYFEPLDEESIRDVLLNETANDTGDCPISMVQFGGQTAINLSQVIDRVGLPLLGSSADTIDAASDRKKFGELMESAGVPQPPGATVISVEEGLNVANTLGYPILVRPSYVLGGRAMEIVDGANQLSEYLSAALLASPNHPILIDKYFKGIEVEVDAVSDGTSILIPGIMEHVERAGVHSGDSMAVYPPINLTNDEVLQLIDYTERIGRVMQINGLMNIQYVIMDQGSDSSEIYVIEVNPRASRTIPFISKITTVPMVKLATQVMLGASINALGYKNGLQDQKPLVGIKAPVFSMSKLVGVDTYLGPEMKSTGEVMGIDVTVTGALSKALAASDFMLPPKGSLLLTIANKDKNDAKYLIKDLANAGYTLFATEGTSKLITQLGIPVKKVNKAGEPTPNAVSIVEEGLVSGVVNTIEEVTEALKDGFAIRRAATERRIPCYTSMDTAKAAIEAVSTSSNDVKVATVNEYVTGL